MGVDLRCSSRFTGAEGMKEFLRLAFELIEVRTLGHLPGG